MLSRFLLPLLLFILSALPAAAQRSVLVILIDDIGLDTVGAFAPHVAPGLQPGSTPNLDSLAAGGLMFTNAIVSPLCSPTRAELLTGRYGLRTKIGAIINETTIALSLSELTIPEMLDVGLAQPVYDHATFGKWHLGNSSVGGTAAALTAGFNHHDGSVGNHGSSGYVDWEKVIDGRVLPEHTFSTTYLTDQACAWMNERAGVPFFALLSYTAAHTPLERPEPPTLAPVYGDLPAERPPVGVFDRDYFLAMVEAVDTELGRLISEIDPEVLATTMIVILGDNGARGDLLSPPLDPDHGKSTLYQLGIRVPMIVWGAGVRVGVEPTLVAGVDLYATVAAIAGVDLAAIPVLEERILDSVNLLPLIEGTDLSPPREWVYASRFVNGDPEDRVGRCAQNIEGWKVHKNLSLPWELFNLNDDPLEAVNLKDGDMTPEEQLQFDDLKGKILALRRSALAE